MLSEFWTREVAGGSLSAAIARFVAWYREEFLALFSRETAVWLTDQGARELVLRPGAREFWLLNERGAPTTPISLDEIAASSLDEALIRRGLSPKAVRLGMEIAASAFFVRRFDIPAAASANLAKLVVADIERKTPFRLADVAYGYKSERHPTNPDKFRVECWILRRDLIAQAVDAASADLAEIAFVRPSATAETLAPPTIMLQGAREASHWFRNVVIALVACIVICGAAGVAATLARQHAANDALDTKIQADSAQAARVRKTADAAAAASRLLVVLREERTNGPLFADLWEEISRILPDGAYVSDFRLTETRAGERAVELVGFATSAVGLPALFDKSPIFADAALTAPITPDEQQKREGFSLRALIAPKKTAAGK